MSSVTEILYMLSLFALRLGVPLVITITIAYFLRKLDARWEEEAGRATGVVAEKRVDYTPQPGLPLSTPLPVTFDSHGKPCWEIKDCEPIALEQCPAYQDPGVPCWQARRQAEGRIPVECYHCEIFLAIQPPDFPQISQELPLH